MSDDRREVVAGPCPIAGCDGMVRSVAGGSLQCDTCRTVPDPNPARRLPRP